MYRAKVYKQCEPTPCGSGIFEGKSTMLYAANLQPKGEVEGVTLRECWQKAQALTRAPVMEWM